MRLIRWTALLVVTVPAVATAQVDCKEDPVAEFQFSEENDALAAFSGSDEHYTQGARFSWTYFQGCAPRWMGTGGARNLTKWGEALRDRLFPNAPSADYGYAVEIGQNFFTPNELSEPNLIVDDRPYAGWLYGSLSYAIVNDTDRERVRTQHQFELQIGVVGPYALGEEVQSGVHDLVGDEEPLGWDNQIDNEPGVQLFYGYQRRFVHSSKNLDFIPGISAAFGNVQDYLGVGGIVRVGTENMKTFPISLIKASAVRSQRAVDREDWEMFAFVGAEGRAVFRNIFLDGNTFEDSHSVDKERFVYDLKAGGSLRYKSYRLSYTFVRRSREFSPDPAGAEDSKHNFGSVSLNWERLF